jgi:tryptophanyl-tRNA synthetase
MFTDPKRMRADVPGEVVNNPVFIYHRAFNPNLEEVEKLSTLYQQGRVGDVEVKRKLAKAINDFLDPIREKRKYYEKKNLKEILMDGTNKTSEICKEVVEKVEEKMHLTYPKA